MSVDYTVKLHHTSDEAFISRVIAYEGEYDYQGEYGRVHLAQNPNLTDTHLMALARDKSAGVRSALAGRTNLPDGFLSRLRSDEAEVVRVQALCNPQSPNKVFVEAVLHEKFSLASKKVFCADVRVVQNLEVFKLFWKMKSLRVLLVHTMSRAVEEGAVINPKILDVVHEAILSGNASSALMLAYCCDSSGGVAKPEVLDKLKDNSRVINLVAWNRSTWASTRNYLLTKYPNENVLCAIVRNTEDNEMLNKIHYIAQGMSKSKSKWVLYWLEKNPAFIPFDE
jgi:hypothetical protein